MPTHALGRGTCNLCVNVRKPLHRTLGRLAFQRGDKSTGAFIRRLFALAGVTTVVERAVAEDSPGGSMITRGEADLIAAQAKKHAEVAHV
jgi:hypothetical protein